MSMAACAVVGGGGALGEAGPLESQNNYIGVTGIKKEDEQLLIEVVKEAMGEETPLPPRGEEEDQPLLAEAIDSAMGEETPAVVKGEEEQLMFAEAVNDAVIEVMGEKIPTLTRCEDDREIRTD